MTGFRDALNKHLADQVELGFEFTLAAASIGAKEPFKVRTRRINMTDKLALELPSHLQELVFEGYRTVREAAKRIQNDNEDPQSLQEMVTNNTRSLPAANALCVVSFIHPKVVETESEERNSNDPDTVWVERLPAEDRIAFLVACADSSSEQAKRLTLFRPESSIDVPYRTVEPVAAEPVRDPAIGAAGV
jgi:hypothetical protein